METNSAKHFALQLGSLISLYVSIVAFIQLLFGVITIVYPDPAQIYYEYEGAQSQIRWGIALLVVFFPAYLALTRYINVSRRASGVPYLGVTKWLIYLSLLVGGIVLLGDLVSVIYFFLNGDLTIRFVLKALTVLGIVGSATFYYLYDARGYWLTNELRSKQYAGIMLFLVIVAVGYGYTRIEAPTEARERALDQRQLTDLGMVQSYVMNAYIMTNALPGSIDELALKEQVPTAPEERDAYVYRKTSETSFELCATFAYASEPVPYATTPYIDSGSLIKNPDDWNHKAGTVCFTRIVNPSANVVPVMKQ